MLEIRNLKLTHIQDSRVILEDFSMVLNPGDRAVIIGEEGNGKSTLLKWIFDPESVSDYMDVQGEMHTGKEVFGYLPQQLPEEDKNRQLLLITNRSRSNNRRIELMNPYIRSKIYGLLFYIRMIHLLIDVCMLSARTVNTMDLHSFF